MFTFMYLQDSWEIKLEFKTTDKTLTFSYYNNDTEAYWILHCKINNSVILVKPIKQPIQMKLGLKYYIVTR